MKLVTVCLLILYFVLAGVTPRLPKTIKKICWISSDSETVFVLNHQEDAAKYRKFIHPPVRFNPLAHSYQVHDFIYQVPYVEKLSHSQVNYSLSGAKLFVEISQRS